MVYQLPHVFIQHDAVRKPLQPPYDEPFSVSTRTEKYFTVKINGRDNTISIDCLKPAHLDTDDLHPTPQPVLPTTPPLELLTPVDVSTSLSTSLSTCHKTLGGVV